MHKLQQQPEKKLNLIEQISQRFTDKLVNTSFPIHRLSGHWIRAAFIALDQASPAGTGISHTDLATLHRLDQSNLQLSYNQFAALSNNMDTKSASQLGMNSLDYADLLIEAHEHIAFFGEQTAIMRKASEEEIAAQGKSQKEIPTGVFNIKAEA